MADFIEKVRLRNDFNLHYPICKRYEHNFRKTLCTLFDSMRDTLYISKVKRTRYGIKPLRFLGPRIWNSLQDNIKLSNNINQFSNNQCACMACSQLQYYLCIAVCWYLLVISSKVSIIFISQFTKFKFFSIAAAVIFGK